VGFPELCCFAVIPELGDFGLSPHCLELNGDLERDLAKQGFRHLDPALPSPTTLCHPDEPVLLQDPEVLLNVLEIPLQRFG